MIGGIKLAGQVALYLLIGGLLAYFSTSPPYQAFSESNALIKLSFAHGAKRKGECKRLSQSELQKLAPNMRKAVSCPRERLPVFVRLEIDGRVLLEKSFTPTGLSRDGPSVVYAKYVVPAGRHMLVVQMRDSKKLKGFDYSLRKMVELEPSQSLAIQFRADRGSFLVE